MSNTMLANVFYEKEKMELKDVPIPEISETEVLIKVRASGICGSDIAYYYGKSPLETPDGKGPLILGHEFSGDIVKVGSFVEKNQFLTVGDRVTAAPFHPCRACVYCRMARPNLCNSTRTAGVNSNGSFAEYVKVEYSNAIVLPDDISYIEGVMVEPLACSSYGLKKLDVQLGDFVVVIGSGTIGIMMAQLIKQQGAKTVLMSGIIDYPLEKAKEVGVDYICNTLDQDSPYYTPDLAAKVMELTDGLGANRVIVPVAAKSAFKDAFAVSGKASTIVFFGLPGEQDIIEIPALETLTSDKHVLFSWLAPYTWNEALRALKSGNLRAKELVTHTFPLEKVGEGIAFMNSDVSEKIKGMIVTDA